MSSPATEAPRDPAALREALCRPFPMSKIKFKPQMVFERDGAHSALVSFYLSKEAVEERLDEVFGPGGWQTEITPLFDKKAVIITLSVYIEGRGWIKRSDIGGESKQPDEGNRQKAAVTYAMRRVGAQLGIGRYLSEVTGVFHKVILQGGDKNRARFPADNPPRLPDKYLPEDERGKGKFQQQPQQAPQQQQPQQQPQQAQQHKNIKPVSQQWRDYFLAEFKGAANPAELATARARLTDTVKANLTDEIIQELREAYAAADKRLKEPQPA